MTVYLVSDGEYSDYSILGIYSTKEKAEEALALYAAKYIEEWEIDVLPPHPPGELRWIVNVQDSGNILSVEPASAEEKYVAFKSFRKWLEPDTRILILWARDKDHAIKIASEKRREMIVSGEWYSND